jgi:hypothetical protein
MDNRTGEACEKIENRFQDCIDSTQDINEPGMCSMLDVSIANRYFFYKSAKI